MGVKAVLGGVLLAIGLVAGPAAGAIAQDPIDLASSHVVDKTGVVAQGKKTIENATTKLYKDHNIDLYVVYVDRFTNPTDAADWANETASDNNLGPTDYLLAVATDGRAYYLSGDSAGPVSDSQLSQIETNDIEPKLKAGDWTGAGVAAADGLGNAVGGGSGGTIVLWLLAAAIVAAGLIVFFVLRNRSKKRGASDGSGTAPNQSELQSMPLGDLEHRADTALVQTDDAVRTSEEELGFAVALSGADSVALFRAALDSAKAQLGLAFKLKQRLDDPDPDTDHQKREWNAHIVQLCAAASEALDKLAQPFDELRALETRIPEASGAVHAAADGVSARIPQSTATLASLAQRYTDASLATVHNNLAQAAARLSFVSTALDAAEHKNDAGDTAAAVIGVRAAEASVDQATRLLDALDRVDADLATTLQRIDTTLAALDRDLAEARGLARSGDPQSPIAGVLTGTEQAIADIKTRIAAPRINPLDLAQQLEAADLSIDDVLQGVRDARGHKKRARTSLALILQTAKSRVSACDDFVTVRRGAIGPEARTRLAEAGRFVAQAEEAAASDPVSALAQAQRAEQLAREAIRLAQRDVGAFQPYPGDIGGMLGGEDGASGAILGGILIGSGSGLGPASFGGSGTRSRRGRGRF